jgi:hypothetical protein
LLVLGTFFAQSIRNVTVRLRETAAQNFIKLLPRFVSAFPEKGLEGDVLVQMSPMTTQQCRGQQVDRDPRVVWTGV